MGKTFCDPVTAGEPGIEPVGMSIRWHLNEKFFLSEVSRLQGFELTSHRPCAHTGYRYGPRWIRWHIRLRRHSAGNKR